MQFINCEYMPRHLLTDFELMILLATLRSGDDAYGVQIAREIERTGGRRVLATGAVMFPVSFGASNTADRTLQPDDIAGVSDLYPDGEFARQTGAIVGRVTLSGSADSAEAVQKAEQIASTVEGVKGVENRIAVSRS